MDGKAEPKAAASSEEEEMSPAEVKKMLMRLMRENRQLKAEVQSKVIKKEPIS